MVGLNLGLAGPSQACHASSNTTVLLHSAPTMTPPQRAVEVCTSWLPAPKGRRPEAPIRPGNYARYPDPLLYNVALASCAESRASPANQSLLQHLPAVLPLPVQLLLAAGAMLRVPMRQSPRPWSSRPPSQVHLHSERRTCQEGNAGCAGMSWRWQPPPRSDRGQRWCCWWPHALRRWTDHGTGHHGC